MNRRFRIPIVHRGLLECRAKSRWGSGCGFRARPGNRFLAAVVFLALGIVSCQSETSSVVSESGPESTTVGSRPNIYELALDDGILTADEYERAVLEIVECIRGAGFSVTGPTWSKANDYLTYRYSVPVDNDATMAFECENGPAAAVVMEWSSMVIAEIDANPEIWKEFAECLSGLVGRRIDYGGPEDQEVLTEIFNSELGTPQFECPHPHTFHG